MLYQKSVLMNPGPVVVDERVRRALTQADLCHREPEFSALLERVRRKITEIAGGRSNHVTVVLTGSGTAALESVLGSVLPERGRLLILSNGHYGERLEALARIFGRDYTLLRIPWGCAFDIKAIETALTQDPSLSHIAMIHHETSTGMLNPLGPVGRIARKLGRSLIVDAISSIGGEDLDMEADGIDWCVGSSNKCFEGVPGLSFVIGRRAAFEALHDLPPKSLYLGLYQQYLAQEKQGYPAFTPAIQTFMALETALDILQEEGLAARKRRYAGLAAALRSGLECAGLQLYLPPEYRSNTLTAVSLPESWDYPALHDHLKDKGFTIYAGQEALKQKIFRLANMGRISMEDIERFLEALAEVTQLRAVETSRVKQASES